MIKNSVDPKNININIGKLPIPFWPVVSVEVDELYFFNQALTAEEIKILSNDESYPWNKLSSLKLDQFYLNGEILWIKVMGKLNIINYLVFQCLSRENT